MKSAKYIPSLAAFVAAVAGFSAPLDPRLLLTSLTFAGVAILLWPTFINQPTHK